MSTLLRTLVSPSLVLGAFLALPASAQLEVGGEPASQRSSLARAVPTLELPPVDVAALRAEDQARGKVGGLRFGEALAVELDLERGGVWEELSDGGRVWRARIHSPGAYSLSLVFSRFQLPPEAELFVYDDRRNVVRGAYTYLNHLPEGGFAIQPIAGDALTLEYFEPAGTQGSGSLAVQTVIHDYVDVIGKLAAGACNLDVACAPALAGQVRATVRTLTGGVACSGVLLNNTADDGTQLLLTSEHCGDMTNAVFMFQFQRAMCGSGAAPTNFTVLGAKTLVKNAQMDYQLVRILPQIPATHAAYLCGWDRSGVVPPSTFALHHPMGDVKSVCVDIDAPTIFGGRWRIGTWEVGTTEGGSSGCGLFDPSGLVIGCLEGGFATCANPSDDRFVRMDVMWPGLAPFLDPLGSGALAIGDHDPLSQPVLPLSGSASIPAAIPILQVGLGREVQLKGTGFDAQTTIAVDGVPVAAGRYGWINPQTLELDFPQVSSIGVHTVTLTKGGEAVDLPVQVVPVSAPTLQLGDGEFENRLLVNADWLIAGQPGDVYIVTFSTSGLPSVHPAWTLAYGNQFTDVVFLGAFTIPASGLVALSTSTAGFFLVRVYTSATLLNGVFPALQSNLQVVFVVA